MTVFSVFHTTASLFGALLDLELPADLTVPDTTYSWEWNLPGYFSVGFCRRSQCKGGLLKMGKKYFLFPVWTMCVFISKAASFCCETHPRAQGWLRNEWLSGSNHRINTQKIPLRPWSPTITPCPPLNPSSGAPSTHCQGWWLHPWLSCPNPNSPHCLLQPFPLL